MPRKRKAPLPVIVVDSREQKPYAFKTPTVTRGLRAGDYSIEGYEEAVSIERKRAEELFTTVSRERGRFVRELEKLAAYQYSAIVVEATLEDLTQRNPWSQVSPKAVINSLLSWSVKYRLPVFFCGSRRLGQLVTLRLLQKFVKHKAICAKEKE